jgi:hypothetical protein
VRRLQVIGGGADRNRHAQALTNDPPRDFLCHTLSNSPREERNMARKSTTDTWEMVKCDKTRYGIAGPGSSNRQGGRVLVHNHVRHTASMEYGRNGFRCWTQIKRANLALCKCGWRPDLGTHYRVKGADEPNYRVEGEEVIAAFGR